ncbi:hypothetical protein MBLNU459_g4805t1 [Dothideomycetes sp. NU459]
MSSFWFKVKRAYHAYVIAAKPPQVTIQINAPDHALDQEFFPLDLPPTASVADLKNTVNAGTGFPVDKLIFYLNGQPVVGDNKTLAEAGIKDGEMLAMLVREDHPPRRQPQQQSQHQQSHPPPQQQRPARAGPARPSMMTAEDIETLRLTILGNADHTRQIQQSDPAMAAALNDATRWRELYYSKAQDEEDRERQRMDQMRVLNEDPFNAEAQRKIEEMIRQDRVMENLEYAYEHNPEVFGRVTMLYINAEVNGHPVKAFVDSGAQTTIMSPSCAEACNIMRLIDTRYHGVARGVGTATILGRVHSADIKIGNSVMPCSFTVMEGKDVDLLLGLDMLKRYQATIDLRRNKLVFENNEVDFLPESELPKFVEEANNAEPTIPGPQGTEIGTQTGTVTQPGPSSSANSNFKGTGQTLGVQTSTAAPSAATPAASATQSAQPQRKEYPKEAIDQLVGLGFTRQEAIAALDATDGNVEYAAGLLFQG